MSVFSFSVYRLILILALLAAAVPAAASAQAPVPAPPVATTGPAELITQTEATLTGTVDRNDGATTYYYEYGTSPAYGLRTPDTPVPATGSDPVTVKTAIQGLTRDTLYNFRLVATNAAGVSTGANRSFRTAPGPRAPSVTSTSSRDVFSRGARLITTADPNGQQTSVRFEYGTSTRYGTSTDAVAVGAGDRGVPVSIPLAGLRPNTRYHFRAVATNPTGAARSLDRSFRTRREPTGISLTLTPSRVIWGRSVTVLGRVAGTAVGGTPVALERQDFPFSAGFSQVGSTRTANRDGSFRFELPSVFVTTQLRVPHAHARRRVERRPHRLERAQGRGAHALQRAQTDAHRGLDLAAGTGRPGRRCKSARRAATGPSSAAGRRSRSTPTARATASA